MHRIKLHFSHNVRYVVFEVDGHHYLLDRKPAHLVCYLFLPLNFLCYQKAFLISREEFLQLKKTKMSQKKSVISPSLIGGFAALTTVYTRINHINLFQYFETQLSLPVNVGLLIFGWFVVYCLLQGMYASKEKLIRTTIESNLSSPVSYQLKVKDPVTFVRKMIGLRIFAWVMLLMPTCLFLLFGNLLLLLVSCVGLFVLLFSAVIAFTPSDFIEYHILSSRDDHHS